MAFILQISSSFSAESFISADTSLQNTSVSVSQGWRWEVFGREGLDQLWWQRQPTLLACFAPKGGGHLLPAPATLPASLAWQLPALSFSVCELPVSRALGMRLAAGLPSSGLVRLFIVGTAGHSGHTTPAASDLPAALLARAELLSRQVSTPGLAAPLAVTAGSQSC